MEVTIAESYIPRSCRCNLIVVRTQSTNIVALALVTLPLLLHTQSIYQRATLHNSRVVVPARNLHSRVECDNHLVAICPVAIEANSTSANILCLNLCVVHCKSIAIAPLWDAKIERELCRLFLLVGE